MKKLLTIIFAAFVLSNYCAGQVTISNPSNTTPSLAASYTSLANAFTALNSISSITGPVVITLQAGNPQTAPAGGYIIQFAANTTAINNIIIEGNANSVTAFSPQAIGSINDAIFKLIGVDYITLQNFQFYENGSNTNIDPGTNGMTEWAVALLRSSTSNGAQYNRIRNNSISLNRNYVNSFGIYSNNTHASATVTSFEDIVNGSTAPQHGNTIYNNTISNVNLGICFIGSPTAAFMDMGNDIGGSSVATANSISNWGGAAAAAAFVNNAAASYGILMHYQNGENVSWNTLSSAAVSGTPVDFTGIIKDYPFSSPPSGSFTSTISNNSITMDHGFASGFFAAIVSRGMNALGTATINIINNRIINCATSYPLGDVNFYGVYNLSAPGVLNITGNIIRGLNFLAFTGSYSAIYNSGAAVNSLNISDNLIGDAVSGAIINTGGTNATITGINNVNAAATSTVTINGNHFNEFSFYTTGQLYFIYNSASGAVATNINNNRFGTLSGSLVNFNGAQSNTLTVVFNNGIAATGNTSILGNDITGVTHLVTATAENYYIQSAGSLGNLTVSNNTFSYLSINTSGSVYFLHRAGNMVSGASYTCNNNSIVGSFTNNAAAASTLYFSFSSSQSVNGSSMMIDGNNFRNVGVNGGTAIFGWYDLEGASNNAPIKTYTNNNIEGIATGTGAIIGMYINNSANVSCSTNTVSGFNSGGNMVGIWHGSTNGQGVHYVSSNTVFNLSSGSGNVVGIMAGALAVPSLHVSDNNITRLFSNGAAGQIVGIEIIQGQTINVNDNIVNNFQGFGSGNTFAYGIRVNTGTQVNLNRNQIYDLRQTGNIIGAATGVIGIQSINPTNLNLFNNFIADLKTPNSGQVDAIRGININAVGANSSYNLYYNSVYLNAASTGTNFGSAGIYHTGNAVATTGRLELINNIIVNLSAPNGTGFTSAYRRSNTNLSNYATASNHNLFYAGVPAASRLIYYDGTNADQSLAAYQARVANRDANSISVLPVFVSATDLHLVPGSNCAIDGRGMPIAAVTLDIDNDSRDATTPDIGADEFAAVYTPSLPGVIGTAVCESRIVSALGSSYATGSCNPIAAVLPSGADPVSGKINTCVTLNDMAGPLPMFNNEPYLSRHYDIEPESGNTTTTSATISLYFLQSEFDNFNAKNASWPDLPTGPADAAGIANLRVTQYHGTPLTIPSSAGAYSANSGSGVMINPDDANITWNGSYWSVRFDVTGFSGFYVHTNNVFPLPISINYFTGIRQGRRHILNWKVSCNGSPRATMILERSGDGRNFYPIHSITADAVRCNDPFDYTDAAPLKGINYYRLKNADADGHITYSSTMLLINAEKGIDVQHIAPNPVRGGRFSVEISSATPVAAEMMISDVQGRGLQRQTFKLIGGFNVIPVNVQNLAAGTYQLLISTSDGDRKLLRFVIQ